MISCNTSKPSKKDLSAYNIRVLFLYGDLFSELIQIGEEQWPLKCVDFHKTLSIEQLSYINNGAKTKD